MSFKRWNGTAYVVPTTVRRWDGSAWQPVQTIKRWDGSSWVTAWTALPPPSVSISLANSHPTCYYHTNGGSCTATTNATANVSGGSGNYSFQWSLVSGTGYTANSTAQTAQLASTGSYGTTATFKVVVTDLDSGETGSAQVTVTFSQSYQSIA